MVSMGLVEQGGGRIWDGENDERTCRGGLDVGADSGIGLYGRGANGTAGKELKEEE